MSRSERQPKPDLTPEVRDGLRLSALETEKLVLGLLLKRGPDLLSKLTTLISVDDFSTEAHRRVFQAISELDEAGVSFDRVVVMQELNRRGHLESVGGVSYLIDLDESMPDLPDITGYVRELRRKTAQRRLFAIGREMTERALLDEDPEETKALTEQQLIGVSYREQDRQVWRNAEQIMTGGPGGFEGFMNPQRGDAGIKTPWRQLNDLTGGLRPGLTLLAGRPSHGKSSAASQIAEKAAEVNVTPAYFSLEMSGESLIYRMICGTARVDSLKFRSGFTNADERFRLMRAADQLKDSPIWFCDRGALTASAIRSHVKALRSQRNVGLVIVDHFHLVAGFGKQETRDRYSEIADSFLAQSKEFNIPYVVLCQLSRKCEEDGRPPGLADLKETGKLEENADLVLAAYRPELYQRFRDREDLRGVADLLVLKQREGPAGKIPMVFLKQYQRFEEIAKED